MRYQKYGGTSHISDRHSTLPDWARNAHSASSSSVDTTLYNFTMEDIKTAANNLLTSYFKDTPRSLKLIDSYMVYVLLTGIIQFVYVVIAGTFPNNAFLAGFISTVASFVLAANLRIQTNPKNASQFPTTSPERAFADFLACNVVVHFAVANFLG
ncbi:Dolichyl-diphosphooligosaccharide-protein glycosyltransferase subunit dad1 [Mortierella sp. GBA30]|nr:Dolichyl-diphosphooligosaccharide-protein glycosyltransferase subunit dad1 [Mortierella sp. GBA30]